MKAIVIDGNDCDAVETACWAAAFGAAYTAEVLVQSKVTSFSQALKLDYQIAARIADAAVRALRSPARFG
jgi:hypothetical protein